MARIMTGFSYAEKLTVMFSEEVFMAVDFGVLKSRENGSKSGFHPQISQSNADWEGGNQAEE
jgi:hypothetical protein